MNGAWSHILRKILITKSCECLRSSSLSKIIRRCCLRNSHTSEMACFQSPKLSSKFSTARSKRQKSKIKRVISVRVVTSICSLRSSGAAFAAIAHVKNASSANESLRTKLEHYFAKNVIFNTCRQCQELPFSISSTSFKGPSTGWSKNKRASTNWSDYRNRSCLRRCLVVLLRT